VELLAPSNMMLHNELSDRSKMMASWDVGMGQQLRLLATQPGCLVRTGDCKPTAGLFVRHSSLVGMVSNHRR
jgi:hypothetical protein